MHVVLLAFLAACGSSPDVELVQHYLSGCASGTCDESLRADLPHQGDPGSMPAVFRDAHCTGLTQEAPGHVRAQCTFAGPHVSEKGTVHFQVADGKLKVEKVDHEASTVHDPH